MCVKEKNVCAFFYDYVRVTKCIFKSVSETVDVKDCEIVCV